MCIWATERWFTGQMPFRRENRDLATRGVHILGVYERKAEFFERGIDLKSHRGIHGHHGRGDVFRLHHVRAGQLSLKLALARKSIVR